MKYKIALFKGDGVGPELIAEGKKVLEKAAELDKFELEWIEHPHSAEHFLETKRLIDLKTIDEIRKTCNAVYCGTFGDPRVEIQILEKGILGSLKEHLGQFISLKPVKLFPEVESYIRDKTHNDVNFTMIRENSEDMYVGLHGRAKNQRSRQPFEFNKGAAKAKLSLNIELKGGEIAYQVGILSSKRCEAIAKFAFEYAKGNGINKITSIDKVNELGYYSIWREAMDAMSKNYGISLEFELIDAAVMNFVRQPEKYRLIVVPNMFGDILSDLSNMIQGGLSFSSIANINPEGISMFEPSHGSAPMLKDKGVVNPIATIIAGAMMLDSLNQKKSSSLIMRSIESVLRDGKTRTQDLDGRNTTSDMGSAIMEKFVELHE